MRTWIAIGITLAFIIAAVVGVRFWREMSDTNTGRDAPTAEETAAEEQQDTEPPAADDEAPDIRRPSFDVVRITRDGKGVIAGRAAPNAEVTVLTGESVIGTQMANKSGEWVLIIDERPLQPGAHELSLTAARGDSGPIDSRNVVIIHIPQPGRGEELAKEEEILAVLTPRTGNAPSRVLQRPGPAAMRRSRTVTLDAIDFAGSDRMNLSGRAEAGKTAHLYIDNQYTGTVEADADGEWSLGPIEAIDPGQHVLRIDQMEDEKVGLRVEYRFNSERLGTADIGEGAVVVQKGNNLWEIARRMYGEGLRFTLIFEANENQIQDPDLIYPEQRFVLPSVEE